MGLRPLLFGVLGTGCVVGPDPSFSPASDGDSASAASTASGSTLGATSQSSGSGAPSEDAPVVLATVALTEAESEDAPQLAAHADALGVSWDANQGFMRFDRDGEPLGLPESPAPHDTKSPELTVTPDGRFYAVMSNFSSHLLLFTRSGTDGWMSLGRQDSASEAQGAAATPFGADLVLAWREDVFGLRIATRGADGEPLDSYRHDFEQSHFPTRLMVREDGVDALVRRNDRERFLFRYDRELRPLGDPVAVNTGACDLWPRGDVFTLVARRDAGLVLGTHDGETIRGELTALHPNPGDVSDIRILGAESAYLVAWVTNAGDGPELRLSRVGTDGLDGPDGPDGPDISVASVASVVVSADGTSISDLVATGPGYAALGWSDDLTPQVSFIAW